MVSPIAAAALARRDPALARSTEEGSRFYTWRGESYWSVTTIIGGGVPKYLHRWAAKSVAALVLDDIAAAGPNSRAQAQVRRWERAGRAWVDEQKAAGDLKSIDPRKLTRREFAERWLKGAPDRIRDEAALRGSAVHSSAEDLVLAQAREASKLLLEHDALPEYPAAIAAYLDAFVRWVRDWQPVFLAAEFTVFNRTQAYGGTGDAIAEIEAGRLVDAVARAGQPVPVELALYHADDGVPTIVDYKSGNDVYREVALQLAAYRGGEFIGAPDGVTELPLPPIVLGAVLHLTPKGPRFRLVRIDDGVLQRFFYAREVFRWAIEASRDVLGSLLEPPPVPEEVSA